MRAFKILIYEPSWDGHHTEFLLHIIRAKVDLGGSILIVCHPKSKEILESNITGHLSSIEIYYLSELDCTRLDRSSGNSLARGRVEWEILQSWKTKVTADKYLLLHLNPMQLEIILRNGASSPGEISGILFNPVSLTLRAICSRSIVLTVRKLLLLFFLVSDERCGRIFLLNDTQTTERLNVLMAGVNPAFRCLPDPVCASPIRTGSMNAVSKTNQKLTFLLFGAMDRRKGTIVLLDALDCLSPGISDRIRIIVAGRFTDSSFYKEVSQRINILSSRSTCEIILHDHYYSEMEMAKEISSADVLLLPYLDSNSSSGILGHAASHRKPVIASSSGLIGRLVREYDMGLLVKPGHCSELAAAMEICVINGLCISHENAEKFCSQRSPDVFAGKILLDTIGGEELFTRCI